MVVTGIEFDYKELVVELMDGVRRGKHDRTMLELRLALFVAACESKNQCLLPFPPCLFNAETKTKDFKQLQAQVELIPALHKLGDETELPAQIWEFLYWVFTNPLTISPIFNPGTTSEILEMVELRTKLQILSIEASCTSLFVFEVKNPKPKPAFLEGKEKHGSYFAFHGSPAHNFHSIIHRGLLSELNCRSALGRGTYLSSTFEVSSSYSAMGTGWSKSLFGQKLRCVAICEVVDAHQGLKKHAYSGGSTVTVVTNDDLVQFTYLLLFASDFCFSSENLHMLQFQSSPKYDQIE